LAKADIAMNFEKQSGSSAAIAIGAGFLLNLEF
jgi:hypothetical protein